MEEQKNLVTEEVTENVEQPTEETVEQVEQPAEKTYTEAEFNAKLNEVLGKKIARKEAKIRKEYEAKYSPLEDVLRAGTGKDSVEEMTDTFRDFYQKKGIEMPTEPTYSDRDIQVLAKAEAADIISAGFEDVVEEVDRLAGKGVENMTAREKAVFKALAEYRQNAEKTRELAKIGVGEDVYNSKEFKDFSAKFSSNTPVTEIYEIYSKTQPKKDIKPMGSMTNNTPDAKGVKDFYTRDEALQFTKKDFDKNPALFKAVERSMQKW